MHEDPGYAYEDHQASSYDKQSIAAIFDTVEDAKEAVRDLHDGGFHKTWIGVTAFAGDDTDATDAAPNRAGEARSATTVRTEEGGGFGAAVARFFGEENNESFADALARRGIPRTDALALENRMHDGAAVLTVDVNDRYDLAMQILRENQGVVRAPLGGAMPMGLPGDHDLNNQRQLDQAKIDDAKTLQLREERLLIEKGRVSAGEATLQKRVVSEREAIDVPVEHDELFISRRPVTASVAATGPIGQGEVIRVPLMREAVVVDKRAFVTEEIQYGKRSVSGTERVEGDVRHEELVIDTDKRGLPSDR